MPKERRDRSVSSDRFRASPFRCSSSQWRWSSSKIPSDTDENIKEWEEARCPVCMEHPHNAVLLICSSHEKGCRPFMCDTSYRHSNCLDQFRKSFATSSSLPEQERTQLANTSSSPDMTSQSTVTNEQGPSSVSDLQEERSTDESISTSSEKQGQCNLLCPLCRGQIKEWIVVEPARRFMNAKPRSCACETCDFTGAYTDLRKHARLEHPLVRPSEADPERQRNWRRLERQRDLGDLLSTLQSSFGDDREDDSILPMDDRGWLTVFFLIRVFQPGSSSRSSSWSGTPRGRAHLSFRRRSTRLWGENYSGDSVPTARDEENDSSDDASHTWRRRLRRRTTPSDDLP